MQAMAATPTPPAIRKPLPSPAAAVESCLACRAARREADAKRENILCWERGWRRGQLEFIANDPLSSTARRAALLASRAGRACHPNRAGAFAGPVIRRLMPPRMIPRPTVTFTHRNSSFDPARNRGESAGQSMHRAVFCAQVSIPVQRKCSSGQYHCAALHQLSAHRSGARGAPEALRAHRPRTH